MKNYQITQWCHHFIEEHVQPGDSRIDAMGKGNDTLFLSCLTGLLGQVLAFDIQEEAISTRNRLSGSGCPENYRLILIPHVHMDTYAKPGSVSCIVSTLAIRPEAITQNRPCPIPVSLPSNRVLTF